MDQRSTLASKALGSQRLERFDEGTFDKTYFNIIFDHQELNQLTSPVLD